MAALRMPTEAEYRSHGPAPFGHVRAEAFTPATVDEAAHAVEGYVSTDIWARDGQRILPQAWAARLDEYRANPIVTWAHSWWDIPIGLATDLRIDEHGLWARLEFDVLDDMAARIWQAIKSRRVRTTSVAWAGEETPEYGELTEQGFEWRDNIGLMEIALVPIPCDTGATFAMARGLGLAQGRQRAEGWHIGSPHKLPAAPEEADWNPDGVSEAQIINTILGTWENEEASPDWETAKRCNVAWQDPGDSWDSFKLKVGRRDPIGNDGTLKLFWRMTASRMAILMGARQPPDIPDDMRRPAYEELSRCYKLWDKTPPEFHGDWPENLRAVTFHHGELEMVEDEIALEDLFGLERRATALANITRHWEGEGRVPSPRVLQVGLRSVGTLVSMMREGRVLSAANRELVQGAVEALQALLAADSASKEGRGVGPGDPTYEIRPTGEGRGLEALLSDMNEERAAAALRAIGVS